MSNELVQVSVDFVCRTDAAILIDPCNRERNIWFPLSLVEFEEDLNELKVGDSFELQVQEWIALENGLI